FRTLGWPHSSFSRNCCELSGRTCRHASRCNPGPADRVDIEGPPGARGPNPTRSELVRTMLRGIKRKRRCTQQQAKALLREDLLLVLDTMGDDLKDIRDRALLLIGFAGALRRSELGARAVAGMVR